MARQKKSKYPQQVMLENKCYFGQEVLNFSQFLYGYLEYCKDSTRRNLLDNVCAIFKDSNWNFPVTFYVRYQPIKTNSESMAINDKGVNFLCFERNCGAENECLVYQQN